MTGTSTRGKPTVTQEVTINAITVNAPLSFAAAAEVGSEHPLGEAIVGRAQELGLDLPKAEHFQAFAGKGIQARIEGQEVLLGNRALLEGFGLVLNSLTERAEGLASRGTTPMFVAVGDQPAGLIAVA